MRHAEAVPQERLDARARQRGPGHLAHVEDDFADEGGVGVGAVGVAAVEVKGGGGLELVFAEEGVVEGCAVEDHCVVGGWLVGIWRGKERGRLG